MKSHDQMKLKGEFDAERLREIAHELSRKSRLFARMIGEADAHATKYAFGMVDSPGAQARYRKNLGLSAGAKINRVSDLNNSVQRPRPDSVPAAPQTTPKFSINRRRPGRVPRIA